MAAVLAAAVQDDSGEIKVPLLPFFLGCQKAWGWLPFMSLFKQKNAFIRPFVLELVMAILFAALFYHVGWQYLLVEYLLFVFAMVTASAVDLERMILPDFLTLSGIVLGLLGGFLNPGRAFWPAFSGVLVGGGFLWLIAICYYALREEDGIGGGDIKLLAWIGAVLTWRAIPIVILLACGLGILAAAFHFVRTPKNWLQQGIPFGPYLTAAALLYLFFGDILADWYLSYFLGPVFLNH